MILILTHSQDLGADLVIRELHKINARYIRVDTDRLGTPEHHFAFQDGSPELIYAREKIRPSDMHAVWARRFARPEVLQRVQPAYVAFTLRELTSTLEAFIDSVSGFHVNTYEADRKAGNRLYQSTLAEAIGFLVPRTIVTQDAEKAKAFVGGVEPVISKAISFGLVDTSGDNIVHTNIVSRVADYTGVPSCPTLFQQAVRKKHEWRITTAGKFIFSARTRPDVLERFPIIRDRIRRQRSSFHNLLG